MWEMNLERWEEKLVEEHAHDLYPFNGRDPSVELEKLRKRVARVENERIKAVQLSWSVMEIFDALVNQAVFPIWDISTHLKSALDVLAEASLILERLREEHASGGGPLV
jgi:hypothetical protein